MDRRPKAGHAAERESLEDNVAKVGFGESVRADTELSCCRERSTGGSRRREEGGERGELLFPFHFIPSRHGLRVLCLLACLLYSVSVSMLMLMLMLMHFTQ